MSRLLLRKSCVCGRYFRGAKGDKMRTRKQQGPTLARTAQELATVAFADAAFAERKATLQRRVTSLIG